MLFSQRLEGTETGGEGEKEGGRAGEEKGKGEGV